MKKKLLALLALLLLFGGTTVAFAYWDNLETTTPDQTLVVGNGVTLQVAAVATAPANTTLVPAEALLKAGDVTFIELTYNVSLSEDVLTAPNLVVTESNVAIDGNVALDQYVNISISQAAATVNGSDVLVTVRVELNNVPDFATYQLVAGKDITFDLTFEAQPQA